MSCLGNVTGPATAADSGPGALRVRRPFCKHFSIDEGVEAPPVLVAP
jgi:hypothetical protein